MKFTVTNGELPLKEKNHIINELKKLHPDIELETITATIDGEEVDVNFTYHTKAFERIRRITGYLVGTIDRFNDAKRAEVEQRVKHSIGSGDDKSLLEEIK